MIDSIDMVVICSAVVAGGMFAVGVSVFGVGVVPASLLAGVSAGVCVLIGNYKTEKEMKGLHNSIDNINQKNQQIMDNLQRQEEELQRQEEELQRQGEELQKSKERDQQIMENLDKLNKHFENSSPEVK